jgi:hypothetical protein
MAGALSKKRLTFLFGFLKLNSTQGLVRIKGGRAIGIGWGASSVGTRFIPSERCIGKMKSESGVLNAKEAAEYLKAHVETVRRMARRESFRHSRWARTGGFKRKP